MSGLIALLAGVFAAHQMPAHDPMFDYLTMGLIDGLTVAAGLSVWWRAKRKKGR